MSRSRLLNLEELGSRILPSATPLPAPPAPAQALAGLDFHPGLHGQGRGAYQTDAVVSGAGRVYRLRGAADLAGLGHFALSGSVHAVGFIAQGHAGGTLTFRNARGTVTLALEGPEQPAFSPLPQTFSYRITGATGGYAGLSGSGQLSLALAGASTGGVQDPTHGSFTLALGPAAET